MPTNPPAKPSKEELLKIAEKALEVPLNEYYLSKVEVSAQHIAEQISSKEEDWNLALIKMMLLTSYRVREIKAEPQVPV